VRLPLKTGKLTSVEGAARKFEEFWLDWSGPSPAGPYPRSLESRGGRGGDIQGEQATRLDGALRTLADASTGRGSSGWWPSGSSIRPLRITGLPPSQRQ
jgi:hypothetical protein